MYASSHIHSSSERKKMLHRNKMAGNGAKEEKIRAEFTVEEASEGTERATEENCDAKTSSRHTTKNFRKSFRSLGLKF